MDNFAQINRTNENGEHPAEDGLLLYVDGELSTKEGANIRAHLEACWTCRARTEKLQEAISSFVDYRDNALASAIEPPPNGWRGFDRKLHKLAVECGRRSLLSDAWNSLTSLFVKARAYTLTLADTLVPQPALRVALGLLIAVLLVFVVLRSNRVTTVSASELLNRAMESESASLRAKADPVTYQKLRVERRDRATAATEVVSLEIWNDSTRARFRRSVADTKGSRFVLIAIDANDKKSASNPSGSNVLIELDQLFQANHMDPARPLSAYSNKAWRDSLAQKNESVERLRLSDGTDAFTLRTSALGSLSEGQIAQADYVVRSQDWHPVELRLLVKAANGEQLSFELRETTSSVLNLAEVSPAIFGPEQPTVAKAETKPSPSLSPKASVEPATLAPNTVTPVASAELEVEVLRLLYQAGADLGEQITVKRTAGGPVRVTGIVETDQRKAEIIAALNSLVGNPAVQIDIHTVAEAVAKQKPKTSASPSVITSEGIEIQSTGIAAEPELRAYFERRGANVDTSVRQFAAGMVSQSHQAMQHLGAMNRLIKQFSPEQLRTLTPDARAKWLSLIREHARAYQQQSVALRRDLRPVFFSGASEDLPSAPAIRSDEELRQTVQELFAAGAANDQVIRSAFTVTSEGARFTAINTPQFWQAMKQAEALAARIANSQ